MNADQEAPSGCAMRVLDWLNVFLADVRAGIGPCLAVYLLTTYNAAGGDTGFRIAEPVFPTGVERALRKSRRGAVLEPYG